MVRLVWWITGVVTAALVAGTYTRWLKPTSSEYLAMAAATALLLGLSLGFAAAIGTARLRTPTFLAFAACLAACAAVVWLLLQGFRLWLPPIYMLAEIDQWLELPAWRFMAYYLVLATVLTVVPSFAVWRWWLK